MALVDDLEASFGDELVDFVEVLLGALDVGVFEGFENFIVEFFVFCLFFDQGLEEHLLDAFLDFVLVADSETFEDRVR